MADLVLACSECGEETVVSQYVDPGSAACRVCGAALEIPAGFVEAPRAAREKQKKKKKKQISTGSQTDKIFTGERSTVTVFEAMTEQRKRRLKRQKKRLMWSPNGATLIAIFIVGAGILSFLRFGPVLVEDDLKWLKRVGMFAVFVVHMTVIVDAFRDNPMHGLLCSFVPFYSLYYVFWICDAYLLRVLVGVLGVPFGTDFVLAIVNQVMALIGNLQGSRWLNEGF